MNRSISHRILVILAALILFFALAPARLSFASGETYVHDYYRYTVEDNSITITGYVGKVEEVTIPSIIAGNPVNTIASGAFANNKSVKTVNLPDTVSTVEQGAFAPGQQVNYPKGGETPSDGDSPDDGGESPAPVTPSEPASDGPAIHDDEGGLVVVDDDGNLVSSHEKSQVMRSAGRFRRRVMPTEPRCFS